MWCIVRRVSDGSNLRCNVIRRSTKGRRQILRAQVGPAHAHVSETNVSIFVQHDIIEL